MPQQRKVLIPARDLHAGDIIDMNGYQYRVDDVNRGFDPKGRMASRPLYTVVSAAPINTRGRSHLFVFTGNTDGGEAATLVLYPHGLSVAEVTTPRLPVDVYRETDADE